MESKINIKKNNYNLRIGIAKDQAFNFYYQDNLDLLKESGVKLIFFSPMNDKKLPENIDGLYIGGGFPEEFAEKLSRNKGFISNLKEKLDAGLPVYAECGGLMYLTQAIIDKNNKEYKMVGFYNAKTRMTKKLQRFGYVELEYEGIKTKAHEFHHSILDINNKMDFIYKYRVKKNSKNKEWQCGLFKKNVLAGYAHVHFYSNLDFFYKILELFKNK
jgi:cobyrinic acid a,c-diamide synthase